MAKNHWQGSGGGTRVLKTPGSTAAPTSAQAGSRDWREYPGGGGDPSHRPIGILRLPVLTLCLCALGGLLWSVLMWLQPVPRPQLRLITATCRDAELPLNAFAREDALALAGLDTIFDVGQASPTSQSREKIRGLIESLSETGTVKRWLFPRQPVQIVYVNALGMAMPAEPGGRARAWLLPDDLRVTPESVARPDDHAIAVADLLDNLAESPARFRLVVLDCQRVPEFWPMGIVRNEFVDAVERLVQERGDRYERMGILLSCSSGEVTWTDPVHGHSAFGHYFMKGLAGAADEASNQDGRVSLAELTDFLKRRVPDWAARNRCAAQHPRLIVRDASPEQVDLGVVDASRQTQFAELVENRSRRKRDPQLLERLAGHWKTYYQLAQSTPHPVHFTPHLWASLEAALMRCEWLYRTADSEAMDAELHKLANRLGELEAARETSLRRHQLSSLAQMETLDAVLPQVPAKSSAKSAAKGDEPAPATTPPAADAAGSPASVAAAAADGQPSASATKAEGTPQPGATGKPDPLTTASLTAREIAGIVERAAQGQMSVRDAAHQLEQSSRDGSLLPVEAELVCMLADHWPAETAGEAAHQADQHARELINKRMLAERVAVPGGELTPRVFRFVSDRIDREDVRLRHEEDKFLASGFRPIRLGPESSSDGIEPSDHGHVIEQIEQVALAVRLHDQLLAELPHVVHVATIPAWQEKSASHAAHSQKDAEDEPDLHAWIRENLPELLREMRTLNGYLSAPLAAGDTDRRRQLAMIASTARELAATRDGMLGLLHTERSEVRKFAASAGLGSEEAWRMIDVLLRLPFSSGASHSPAEQASQRRALLECSIKSITAEGHGQSGSGSSVAADSEPTRPDVTADDLKLRVDLALAYYGICGIPGSRATQPDSGGTQPAVAARWSHLFTAAVSSDTATIDDPELFEVVTASRLICADSLLAHFATYERLPARVQHRRELSDYLIWTAGRRMQDFWAGRPDAATPYFCGVAQKSLRAAQTISGPARHRVKPAVDRLEGFQRLSARLRKPGGDGLLPAQPPQCMLRGVDAAGVSFAIDWPTSAPAGLGGLECTPKATDLVVRPVSPTDPATPGNRSTAYPVSQDYRIERSSAGGLQTTLQAIARFRGHRCTLRVPVQVISENEGPITFYEAMPPAPGELAVRWAQAAPQSANVLFVIDCSRSMARNDRMSTIRDVLLRFADSASQSGLNIGLRVFGDQVVWTRGDATSEMSARKDTRLLIPVQPYPGRQWRAAIAGLKPKGETPLFQALLAARQDLDAVPRGVRSIIVISDGADNWASTGQQPGIEQLQEAYRDSGISVQAIGFQTDRTGYDQLQQITRTTGGRCVRVEKADALLSSVFGLAEVHSYDVIRRQSDGDSVTIHSGPLGFRDTPISTSPGQYEIRVRDHQGQMLASRAVEIQSAQRHVLYFQSGQLNWPRPDLTQDLADVEHPELPVTLRVVRADILDDGAMEIVLALMNSQDPQWQPKNPVFRIRPRLARREYRLQNRAPNVAGTHLPMWKFRLERWPVNADYTDIIASWEKPGMPSGRQVAVVDWTAVEQDGTLPEGIHITRRKFVPHTINGHQQPTAIFTLVFDERQPALNPADWSVRFDRPVAFAREAFNLEQGIHTGQFTFPDGQPPQRAIIEGPRNPDAEATLKATVNLRVRSIQ